MLKRSRMRIFQLDPSAAEKSGTVNSVLFAALLCICSQTVEGTSRTSPFSVDPSARTQDYYVEGAAGVCQKASETWNSQFDDPTSAAVLASGAVLVADSGSLRILKVKAGHVHSISGSGGLGYADGANEATMYRSPSLVSSSPDGKWAAVLDGGNPGFGLVRRIDLASGGIASTLACGATGWQDGKTEHARFKLPEGLAVSPDGTWIAIADTGNNAIRKVDLVSGMTSTIVGMDSCSCTPQPSCTADTTCLGTGELRKGFEDGFSTLKFSEAFAQLCSTVMTPVAPSEVEIVSVNANTTRLTLTVNHKGVLEDERTIFKSKSETFVADLASALAVDSSHIVMTCSDSDASLCSGTPPLLTAGNATRVRMIVSNVATAKLEGPTRLAFSPDGTILVVSDTGNKAIRQLDFESKLLSTRARNIGGGLSCDPPCPKDGPSGLAVSADKRVVLVAEPRSHSIRRIDLVSGHVSTLAGNSTDGVANGLAARSTLRNPEDVAFGPDDKWAVIVDTGNNCLRNLTIVYRDPLATTPSPFSSIFYIARASRLVWHAWVLVLVWWMVAVICLVP